MTQKVQSSFLHTYFHQYVFLVLKILVYVSAYGGVKIYECLSFY